MAISPKTQKMLWGRAASRCAFNDCRKELVMDATETDDESIIGEACHIVARSADGPRGTSDLNSEQRDKYNNLILLCNVHHKIIDDQPGEYTVEKLHTLKHDHENWVRDQLQTYDASKQRDDEIYTSYLEQFENYIDIEEWNNWTSFLLAHGQPRISKINHGKLHDLRTWLLNRVWPKRYDELELAFENFRRVLQDFLNIFDEHAVDFNENQLIIEKFYHIDRWDPELYERLFKEFEYTCYLAEDLAVELNRAGNYICDKVRKFLLSKYRVDEGALLIMSGPHFDMSFQNHRAEYRKGQRIDLPYFGVEQFSKTQRFERDLYFGKKT